MLDVYQTKPLGYRAYDAIPVMYDSKREPGESRLTDYQELVCILGPINRRVFVQPKLDGVCVAVAKLENDEIVALTRGGYLAKHSMHEEHHMWVDYVEGRKPTFEKLLVPGERVVGEWLAQAHSTKYDLTGRDPFVPFDMMTGKKRMNMTTFYWKMGYAHLPVLNTYPNACSPGTGFANVDHYGAEEPEGVIFRVEKAVNGVWVHDFIAKWVHPNKKDRQYLDGEPVWNWTEPD